MAESSPQKRTKRKVVAYSPSGYTPHRKKNATTVSPVKGKVSMSLHTSPPRFEGFQTLGIQVELEIPGNNC
jgi:hypothetical protein